MKKLIFPLLLLIILPLVIWAVTTQKIDLRKRASFTGPTLALTPATLMGNAGDELTLGITMDTHAASVSAAQIHLTYDPQIVHVTEFTPETFLPVVLSPPVIATDTGTISVALGSQPDNPVTGAAIIGTIKFSLINNSPTSVAFTVDTAVTEPGNPGNALAGLTNTAINGGSTPTPAPTATPTPTPLGYPTATPTPSSWFIGTPTPSPSPTPGTSTITCNNLLQANADSVAHCAQISYSGICFDKYNGAYQGCADASGAGCTFYNDHAASNMVCLTGYTPTPSPTPTPICTRGTPQVTLSPHTQNGNPGQALSYIASITNTDSQGCGSSPFTFSDQVSQGFTAAYPYTSLPMPAGATTNMTVSVRSPSISPFTETQGVPVSFTATNTVSGQSGHDDAAYVLVKPVPTPISFKIKFAGVNGAEATGATIQAVFDFQGGGPSVTFAAPLPVSYVGDGVYEAHTTLANPFAPGTPLTVFIKGQKHIGIRFCQQTGQTAPCTFGQSMSPSTLTFDFTGRPLPAGDLNSDNQISPADITLVTDIFKKPSSQITDADKATADVNFDGYVDNFDLNLILQSLSTRFNE